MEIIQFIKDLRKKNILYYNVWMPIIMQFDKDEYKRIKLSVQLNVNKNTYYRAISYGLEVFPKYLKNYTLTKNRQELILSMIKKDTIDLEINPKKENIENEVIDSIKNNEVLSKKKDKKDSHPIEVYEEIINYLNQCSGKRYKVNSSSSKKIITSRLNEGYTIDDFKQVISIKCSKWLNTDMEQFLRPETLFSNRFESYLNEKITVPKTNIQTTYDTISDVARLRDSQG